MSRTGVVWSFLLLSLVTQAYGATGSGGGRTPTLVLDSVSANPNPVTGTQTQLLVVAHGGTGNLTYSWTAPNTTSLSSSTVANPIATFTHPGSYPFQVTVQDAVGDTVSGSTTVVVNATGHVNQPPVAIIKLTPSLGTAPLNVLLNGSTSYDPDGHIVNYFWNLGAGQGQGSTSQLTHIYSQPGTYTITLSVTDDMGATTSTSTVLVVSSATVTTPPPPQPPMTTTPGDTSGPIVTRVFPRAITPNGDGLNDVVTIVLNNPLDKPAHGEVFDIQAAHVAHLQPGVLPNSLQWDGKDLDGRVVPGGIYIYQVEVGSDRYNGTVVVIK